MKKVDIRVIGEIEVDMNILTDSARERAEQLFLAYAMVQDNKAYLKSSSWGAIGDDFWSNDFWFKLDELNFQAERIETEMKVLISNHVNIKSLKGVLYRLLKGSV